MMNPVSRREWFLGMAVAPLAGGVLLTGATSEAADAAPARWQGFPRQDLKWVREMVGASHGNEAKVRELVKAHPALANAAWDWGFGDWETPLGAASHTGNRAIAEFLLEHGARIDIFAAAMLGFTEVVTAFVTARPGVQKTLGPHGITLFAHAKYGGTGAEKTLAYLKTLGDADPVKKMIEMTAERKAMFVGQYAAEDGPEKIEIKLNKAGQMMMEFKFDAETVTRGLNNEVDDTFFPSGAASVKIAFTLASGKVATFTITDGTPVLKAKRV